MRPAFLTSAVPAVLIAIALGGCGLTDPYQQLHRSHDHDRTGSHDQRAG